MLRANQMAGSRTVIVFQRDGMAQPRREEIVCTVVREPLILGARRIPDGTWDFMLDRQHKIGLIRVGLLTSRRSDLNGGEPDTEEQIRKAIADLRESGLRGLILDLRECPGGVVQGAVQVADMFLDEKLIATLHSRGDGLAGPSERMSGAENSILDLPLVVLVGPDTSGGGELIAAALQDHGRARIAGQRTRGKASVQSPTVGIMGVYVRLTTGAFVRPSGKNLNRFADSRPSEWGVQPEEDLEVRLSAGLRRRLRAWRCQQDHQPVDPRVMLPLDDPEKDPVLYAGWQDLVKRRGQ
jgi:carboxyl-terminal processing protease